MLEEALQTLRGALQTLPADHQARPPTLKLLGDSLLRRFERFGDFDDVQEALQFLTEAVGLSPDIDPRNDLGYCLVCRFEELRDLNDIQDAVRMFDSSDGIPDDSRKSVRTLS